MLDKILMEAGQTSEQITETPPQAGCGAGFDFSNIGNWFLHTGLKIVIAIFILIVSFKIINAICRRIEKRNKIDNFKYDKTITHTLTRILKIGLKIVVCICLVGYLGIDTSGLTALVTSIGVCIGLAVNGALSNLAGGVIIIFNRPFKLDDFIEAQGITGTVEDIGIISTKVRTPDNKIVYVPNGALANGNIINYSEKELRRVDFTFSIGYGDDFKKAEDLIKEICLAHEKVQKDPAPFIRLNEHGSSSINIVTRVWVKTEDYWDVYFDIMESVKSSFDANGIEIPFDQLDVHVKND